MASLLLWMHSTCLGLLCIWQCLKYFYFFESRTKWFFYNLLLFETDVLSWHLNYEGGWSWFGMAWGGMDPTDFNVNWTHPTKIPPITIYGAIVQTLPKAQRTRGLSSSCQSNFLRSHHKFKNKSWSHFIFRILALHQLKISTKPQHLH